MKMENKFILDACCGSRMFWFDKKQPNTLLINSLTKMLKNLPRKAKTLLYR